LIEVLQACHNQLAYYQNSKFACEENGEALAYLGSAIAMLEQRRDRREQEGKLGTSEV
jgi:hypothetical protein